MMQNNISKSQNKKILFQLLDDMPVPVISCNSSGEILFANYKFKSLFYNIKLAFQENIKYFEFIDFCFKIINAAFEVNPIEMELKCSDGQFKWYKLKGHTANLQDTNPIAIIVLKDINNEKKLSSQLMHTEQKLNTVLASERVVLFSVESNGTISSVDGIPLRTNNINNEILLNKNIFKIFKDNNKILSVFKETFLGNPGCFLLEFREKYFDVYTFPFKENENDLYKITGLAFDVTDRELNSKALDQHKEALVKASKLAALGEMASGISHEINNPLTIIYGNLCALRDLLKDKFKANDEPYIIIKDILKTVERIEKIIEGLRIFSRDGRADSFQVVTVSEIVEETFLLCEQRIQNQGIQFIKKLNDINTCVYVSSIQISEILLNLLNNSFDAIKDELNPWIRIECRLKDRYIIISIENSGAKIKPEVVNKLFQPFFTTKPIGLGTGLGLSISKGLAEANRSKIYYVEDSEHTKFEIMMPTYES